MQFWYLASSIAAGWKKSSGKVALASSAAHGLLRSRKYLGRLESSGSEVNGKLRGAGLHGAKASGAEPTIGLHKQEETQHPLE